MWLSRKLTGQEKQNVASAEAGTVTIEGAEVAVYASGEERNVRVASPSGLSWRPKSGARVLVIKGGTFGEEPYVVGEVQQSDGTLSAGEIRIAAAEGNAEIILHKSGRVDINGELYINGAPYMPPIIG